MPFSSTLKWFFAKRLSPVDFWRLEPYAQDGPVFEYHTDDKSFELAEKLGWEVDLESGDLDLLLYCCEILNQEAGDDIKHELAQGVNQAQEHTFSFTFEDNQDGATRNNLLVAQKFIKILDKGPNFRYQVEESHDQIGVEVTITFQSELEYQRKKDELDWLLQLAQRQVVQAPFRGSRFS